MIHRHKLVSDICLQLLTNYFPPKFRTKVPMFLDKFIMQNQELFKHDSVILDWLKIFETQVYFDPNDYFMEYAQIEGAEPSQQIVSSVVEAK